MKLFSVPYENYLDSNNEWLHQLPSEWEEKRVKDLFKLVTDIAPNNNKYELLSLYTSIGVKPRKDLEARGNKASSTDGYWLVKKGDIVVNKLLAWMGAIGLSNYDGVTSPAYDILRKLNPSIDERFFTYLFRTEKAQQIFKKSSRGIMDMRLRLYFDRFGAIIVAVPPFIEQKTISDYLDTKTAQIDRKIDLLTQKVNKYGNLKQSLINETVTHGLDKTVAMKDSEVEWIEEIPKHWKVKRVKELFDISRGRVIAQTELIDDGKYPVYSSQTKDDGCLGYINTFDYEGDYITWTTDGANAGTVFLRSGKFNCTNICGTLKLNKKSNHVGYLKYSLQVSTKHNKRIDTNGAKIMSNEMMFIKITIPPYAEQIAIADYLNAKTTHIDRIIETINLQIEKLKELRKTLINDVVTGKIKIYKKGETL